MEIMQMELGKEKENTFMLTEIDMKEILKIIINMEQENQYTKKKANTMVCSF